LARVEGFQQRKEGGRTKERGEGIEKGGGGGCGGFGRSVATLVEHIKGGESEGLERQKPHGGKISRGKEPNKGRFWGGEERIFSKEEKGRGSSMNQKFWGATEKGGPLSFR